MRDFTALLQAEAHKAIRLRVLEWTLFVLEWTLFFKTIMNIVKRSQAR